MNMPPEERPTDAPRLCIFLPSLDSGGVQRMFVHMARYFAEQARLRVDLVLGEAKGPHLAEVPESVRVIDLKSRRHLLAARPLARYLAEARPAALLTGMPHSNVVAVWARARAGVDTRVVISEHNPLGETLASGAGLSWRVMPPLIRRYYPRADAIIAVSNEVAASVARAAARAERRVSVVPNPALTDECARRMREELEHPWFTDGAPPVVLSVGRLVDQKDFPTLVRAFARVRARRAARLLILGEGAQRGQIQALCDSLGLGGDVALPGHIDNPYPFYARSAVFALSSMFEGFGNVLVEAMAAGTSVVATRCGGPAEILADGKYGPLTPVGDDQALAEAIHSLLDHPTPPACLQKRAEEFKVSAIAPLYLQALGLARPQEVEAAVPVH